MGKALGGASGGYTAAKKEVVEWLRQRSRPYLFSNSLAPAIVAASLQVLELLKEGESLRQQLWDNTRLFREKMTAASFTLAGAEHAIIPVMLGDASLAQKFANALLEEGIYGREMFETWYKMVALIQSGLDLTPMITHRFSIDAFQQGFDAMRSGQSGKVVLDWG